MSIDPTGRTILVTGATGQQGGATAARLLQRGWNVRALTRDPESAAAWSLQGAGAQIAAGSMLDRASLDVAMRGVHGVFSVQPTWASKQLTPEVGPDDEMRGGRNIADAAAAARIAHIVYASSIGADPEHELSSLRNKGRLEAHIRGTGLTATMLRPVSFMENYLGTARALRIRDGKVMTAIAPDVQDALIATSDIGTFAELAFTDPDRYADRAFGIAGDRLTPPQIASALSDATGLPITYEQIPIETLRQHSPRIARAFETINEQGFDVDIEPLRAEHPGLLTFASWLTRIGREELVNSFAPATA